MKKPYLIGESILVFWGIPLLVFLNPEHIYKIPTLLIVTLAAFLVLKNDKTYNTNNLYSLKNVKPFLGKIVLRALIIFPLLTLFTLYFYPEEFFAFPAQRPLVWLFVMILYPILSAWPQELIYREFFFKRYTKLFNKEKYLGYYSISSFAFLHIIYGNIPAVVLTLGGGYLFTKTYRESRSLIAAAIEHAIYGCIIFTVGLGKLFYETGYSNTLPK